MALAPQLNTGKRAPRVKLLGTVLAIVELENGRKVRSRLHQLSVTGGLLQLENPLDENIRVQLMFHVGDTTIRSKAAMLFPMWATKGCLQPFEFRDLPEEDRNNLDADLNKLLAHGQARPQAEDAPVELSAEEAASIEEIPADPPEEASAEQSAEGVALVEELPVVPPAEQNAPDEIATSSVDPE